MGIGRETDFDGLGPEQTTPDLAVSEEKALLGGEPVDLRARLADQRLFQGQIRDFEAADVGDVLALCQRSVNMLARKRLEGRILGDNALGAEVEVFGIFDGPLVVQVAVRIEFAALVVETMRHLVADDRTDRAVVHGVVGLGVKKRRL